MCVRMSTFSIEHLDLFGKQRSRIIFPFRAFIGIKFRQCLKYTQLLTLCK